MTQLQIKQKEYIILFKDNSVKIITERQYDFILTNLDKKAQFIIKKEVYDKNMFSKIMPLEEYYKQYPDKRPEITPEYKNFDEPIPFTKQRRIKAFTSLISGFKSTYNHENPKSAKFIKKMEDKLQETYNLPPDNPIHMSNPLKEIKNFFG